MIPSVYRIFRESLEYAASESSGKSFQFADANSEAIIQKAASLSGLSDTVGSGSGLLSIFNIIDSGKPEQYAGENQQGLFDGFQTAGPTQADKFGLWKEKAALIPDGAEFAQSYLECFEDCFSTVPSPLKGISCYHWGKTIASIACVLQYNADKGVNAAKPFALFSIDFSGIQSFIYTIISAGALKALKTRSLYLSVLSEHICDLMLTECGLPRCNLVYVGGGRAHLLLSVDKGMIDAASRVVSSANQFMKKNFGTSLYLASGWTEASEDALHSSGGTAGTFSELFRDTSRMISENKLRKFSFSDIQDLNREPMDTEGRICAICGRSGRMVPWKDGKHLCRTCSRLEGFSVTMTDECDSLFILGSQSDAGLPVPGPNGEVYTLCAGTASVSGAIRKYTVNHAEPEAADSVRIFISRHHAAADEKGIPATFASMADASEGIHRLGVFRGDVDSLGVLFAKGFYRADDKKPWKNCNISYYSALSGALTWFFQRNLDRVLKEGTGSALLKAKPEGQQVTVVYAGGDDVFLVGAWNDVLDASLKIQSAFTAYTGGTVTLSGGYSFFPEKTPVPVMADDTADLEEEAKQMDGKNAIALFGADADLKASAAVQRYKWDDFRKNVLNDKIPVMKNLFEKLDDKGNSFLYHILGYFRQIESSPMAISRLAYLLARHKPSKGKDDASKEKARAYDEFMKKTYQWALDPVNNMAFRTACLIYVYMNRTTNDR